MSEVNAALVKLSARLPLRVSHALGAGAGWLLSRVPNGARRVTDINLALCLSDLDEAERRMLRRRSLMHTGRMLMEAGRIWLASVDEVLASVRDVRGQEVLDRALDRGRGVLLAVPHLGCWEVMAMYVAARHPVTAMYKPQGGALDELVRRSRERMGARLVPTDNRGVRELLAALRRGEIAGVLPDQDGGRNTGVYVDFFDHPANTPVLLPKLAARTGAPVVFGFGERLPAGRGYRIHYLPGSPEIADPDTEEGARAMNRDIERCVRRLPEQYWWSYKRFRRAPPGQPSVYERGAARHRPSLPGAYDKYKGEA